MNGVCEAVRHDFVVVETIDFHDDEDVDLPPSMSLKDVMALNKARPFEQEDNDGGGALDGDGDEMEMDVEMDDEERALVAEAAKDSGAMAGSDAVDVMEDDDLPRKIVKDYKRVVSSWASLACF